MNADGSSCSEIPNNSNLFDTGYIAFKRRKLAENAVTNKVVRFFKDLNERLNGWLLC